MTSHAPSTRLGACDPCRNGDHAGCDELTIGDAGGGIDTLCTCYDDSWEWHEEIGRRLDLDALPTSATIDLPDLRVDLGGGMVVPLAELLEDE